MDECTTSMPESVDAENGETDRNGGAAKANETTDGSSAWMESSGCRRDKGKTDQAACTPDYIYDALHAEFSFKFDPAPVEPKFDGLQVAWESPSYVNPPYNDLPTWLEKAVNEMRRGVTSVFLIPFRPHRFFFHTLIMPNASEIRFLRERVIFKGYTKPARFGLCVIIFRPEVARALTNFSILTTPSALTERTVDSLRRNIQAARGLTFDYVSCGRRYDSEELWGAASFVCVTVDVEKFIDRCEKLQSEGARSVVLVVPMRNADSSYFLGKVMFGKARAVSVVCPPLICDGYQHPSPDASVVLVYGPGNTELSPTPRLAISDIRRPPKNLRGDTRRPPESVHGAGRGAS